jgi:hypothetical protein
MKEHLIIDYRTMMIVVLALFIIVFICRYEKFIDSQKKENQRLDNKFELPPDPEYYKKEVLHKL